ncbi:hypothetical protein [Mycobacterium sp. 155]|uniref:hypothetical protein n=1 Tax=Mycobacterium sp. 155 TaxID=1157943 RepID=UPI00035D970B|nr:hypothetical protein [Mycobacterium sp. 155]
MADDSAAKVYSDQRDLPIYLGDSGDGFTLPFRDKWRAPDAIAAVAGFIITAALVTTNLESGHALAILVCGVVLTVAAVGVLAKLPHGRPSLPTRLRWWWADLHPRVMMSHNNDGGADA